MNTHYDEVSTGDGVEDFVNGGVGWQSAVEDVELSFQSLRYVVATTARVDHRSHHLYVDDAREFSRLL